MPNHCENDLTVTGDKKELSRFKELAKGACPFPFENEEQPLYCHQFIPAPKEAVEDYNNIGYDWCIANWGSKWGAYDVELQEDEAELFYTFNSAWSPILPVVKKMAEMFPELTFDYRYYEGGMGFHGVLRIEKGKVVIEKQGEYLGQRGG